MIENYDKCINIVKSIQLKYDEVKAATVCEKMIDSCIRAIDNFKMLPLAWNYLFVSQTYHLIQLARNCYRDNCDGWFQRLFEKHANFVIELRQHFSKSSVELTNSISSTSSTNLVSMKTLFSTILISSTDAVKLKLSRPNISLNALIDVFNENAKCAAEQVPVALTSIMHEYCYLDPFYFGDFELVKMNVANKL